MPNYPPKGMYGKAYPPPARPADKSIKVEKVTLSSGKVVPAHTIPYFKDGKLTIEGVAYNVRNYFALNDEVGIRMTALIMAESGGDQLIEGGPNSNNTYDYGLCQINDAHFRSGLISPVGWYEPAINLQMAKKLANKTASVGISNLDQFKWDQWSAFNSGAYETHLDAATKAWNGLGGSLDQGSVKEQGLPQLAGAALDETLKSLGLGGLSSLLWVGGGILVAGLGVIFIIKGSMR